MTDLAAIHAESVPSRDARYDRPRRVTCTRAYVICSGPRTGSSLLCQGLWDLGTAGLPAEYFNDWYISPLVRRWRCRGLGTRLRHGRRGREGGLLLQSRATQERYVRELLARRSTDNGVFGVKVHHGQHLRELGGRPFHEFLPEPRYVMLTREDRRRQAVSLSRALQTKRYRSTRSIRGEERYDLEHLRACQDEIEREREGWERYFAEHGVDPLRITYEQVTGAYDEIVVRVARHAGADVPEGRRLPPSRMQKLGDGVSEAWLERWERDLRGSGAASGAAR